MESNIKAFGFELHAFNWTKATKPPFVKGDF